MMEFTRFPIIGYACSIVSAFLLLSTTSVTGQISCIQELNVSLDHDCKLQLETNDFLTAGNPSGSYSLMVTTASGVLIPSNIVTIDHLWTKVTAKITQDATGNSCWAHANVEDKLGPQISCTPRIIDCFEMHDFLPTAVDSCSSATVEVISNEIEELECDPVFVKNIYQTYRATDGYGNSSTCTQKISLKKFDTSEIQWPMDFLVSDSTNLTCADVKGMNCLPEIELTGTPFIVRPDGPDADTEPDTISLFPFTDHFCNIGVDYMDMVTKVIGCKKVIMRTFRVAEWACVSSSNLNRVQKIEIADTQPPTIVCPDSEVILDSDGSPNCRTDHTLELPLVEDDCICLFDDDNPLEIDIQYPGGFVNNATGPEDVELSGSSLITYTVYDRCGNKASCQTTIEVVDGVSPTAVCDQNSVVSLRSDGTAVAHPGTFDDGSYDDCNMSMLVIKREEDNCGCDRPVFQDYTYLGAHGGNNYYRSKYGFTAFRAFKMAEALEGNVVHLNTLAEADWIVDAALVAGDSVYIGATTIDHSGLFTWSDHTALTYNNWAVGQLNPDGTPAVPGDYVILNAAGRWEIVSGNKKLNYILELPGTCGFSEKINFCCADAGNTISVVLKVIDESGGSNKCWANVVVQDKIEPIVTCPPDMTFDCAANVDFTSLTAFGVVSSTDLCGDPEILGPVIDATKFDSHCGSGSVVRTFTISDSDNTVTCVQTLTPVGAGTFNSNMIDWPDDLTVNACPGGDLTPTTLAALNVSGQISPIVPGASCVSLSDATFKDWPLQTTFGLEPGICQQIIRTWTVNNFCQLDANGAPTPYVWQQVINVRDVSPPVPGTDCEDMLTVDAPDCTGGIGTGSFSFSLNATDNCGAVTADVTEQLFYSGTPLLVGSNLPTGTLFESNSARPDGYPVGDHRFIIRFEDGCGNTETCEKIVRVQDAQSATISCISVSVPVQLWNGVPMVTLSATSLVNVSYGCSVYNPSYSFSPNTVEGMQFLMCDMITPGPLTIPVYVTDSFGLDATCTATVTVEQQQLCGNVGGGGNGACWDLNDNGVGDPEEDANGDGVINDRDCVLLMGGCNSQVFQICNEVVEFIIDPFFQSSCPLGNTFTYMYQVFDAAGVVVDSQTGAGQQNFTYRVNQLPAGDYEYHFMAMDECGRDGFCIKPFTVESCTTQQLELPLCNLIDDVTVIESFCQSGDFIDIDHNVISPVCAPENLNAVVTIDYFSDGVDIQTFTGPNNIFAQLDAIEGTHTVNLQGEGCGEFLSCTKQFVVRCEEPQTTIAGCGSLEYSTDCDNPVAYQGLISTQVEPSTGCVPGIQFTLTYPNGQTLLITDAGQVNFTADPSVNGYGVYTYTVEASGCGPLNSCSGSVNVVCQSGFNGISGNIATETAHKIKDVEVSLLGSTAAAVMTTDSGTYAFEPMPAGSSYRIVPTKDTDHLEGISTLDLIKIQRHILGMEVLDSPYKVIAADIDKSDDVNGIDLIELRKLILGIYEELPSNDAWRIIDGAQQFIDASAPFGNIQENYTITQLQSDMQVDFVGVKVGDVDNSYVAFTGEELENRSDEIVTLLIDEAELMAGDIHKISVRGADLTLEGLQAFINIDVDKAELIEVIPVMDGLTEAHFNTLDFDLGQLGVVFDNEIITDSETETALFDIVLIARESAMLSELVSLRSDRATEAYIAQTPVAVELAFPSHFDAISDKIELFQNRPNPWSDATEIKFYLPQSEDITLSVYDLNGRLLYQEQKTAHQGINIATLDKADLNAKGVLYYELVSGSEKYIQKMILLD